MRIALSRGRAPLPTGTAGSAVVAFDLPLTGPVVAVDTVWPPRVGLYRRAQPSSSGPAPRGARGPAGGAQPVGPPLVELYGAGGVGADLELSPLLGPYVLRSGTDETLVQAPSGRTGPWTAQLAGRGYEMSSPRRGSTVVRRDGGPAVLTSTTPRVEGAVGAAADAAGLAVALASAFVLVPEGGGAPFSAMVLDDAEDAAEEAVMGLLGLCGFARPVLPDAVRRRIPGPVSRWTTGAREQLAGTRPSTAEQFWQTAGPGVAPDLERRAMRPPWTSPPWTQVPWPDPPGAPPTP